MVCISDANKDTSAIYFYWNTDDLVKGVALCKVNSDFVL